jgi:hypothetical protein
MSEFMGPSPEGLNVPKPSRKERFSPRKMMMRVGVGTGMLVGLLGIGGKLSRAEAAPISPGAKQVEISPSQERLMQERAIRVAAATQVFKASHPELVKVEIDETGAKRERFEGQFDPSQTLADLIQASEKLSVQVRDHQGENQSFKEDYLAAVKIIRERFKDVNQDVQNSMTMGLGRIFGLASGVSKEPLMIKDKKIEKIETAGDLAQAVELTAGEVWSQSEEGIPDSRRLELTQAYIEAAATIGVAGAQEAMNK